MTPQPDARARQSLWQGAALDSHFQPIYCLRRAIVVADEALVRADGQDKSRLRAYELFGIAGDDGRARLDWTCRTTHLRNYATVDPGQRRLHLNVHPAALLGDLEQVAAFAELVRYYGLAPERICLEILESECDERALVDAVAAHREAGFFIAMDHFGQGRSNLDRLVMLQPRLVKLDQRLVVAAFGEERARQVLPAMVDMLRETGAEIAVTGIVDAKRAMSAIEAGAHYLQGFHLGAPRRALHDDQLVGQMLHSARRLVAA